MRFDLSYTYDQSGNRLTHSSQATFGNVGIYDYTYQSNKKFNVTEENQVTDSYQIDTLEADREYGYDTLDRLTSAALTDSSNWSAVAAQTTSWSSLDDLGNWLTHSDRGATAINRTFDKANRMNDWGIVNTATLHNAAGNQVKLLNVAGTQLYNVVYDSLNRLQELRNTANTSTVALFDYDALGRRILFYDNKTPEFSRWYYYDGVNEILETSDDGSDILRWYVHGLSYIDERLMMHAEYDPTGENEVDRSYYYAFDRMYNVRYLLDAAGAIVESYAYDPYGNPLIRECAGRGDMTGDSIVSKDGDEDAFLNAMSCTTFDPRADVDDDGDVDRDDAALYDAKIAIWDGTGPTDVKTARSLIGNPYMFQGRPHFVAWTDYVAEHATLMLNDHRNRFADPMTGRWLTRDPIGNKDDINLYRMLRSNPTTRMDPSGLASCDYGGGNCVTDVPGPSVKGRGQCPYQGPPEQFRFDCEATGGTYSSCSCPSSNTQGCPVNAPGLLVGDGFCREGPHGSNPFHSQGTCFRGYLVNAGMQCCYDKSGCLIADGDPGAGTEDLFPPSIGDKSTGDCENHLCGIIGHFAVDVIPFMCSKLIWGTVIFCGGAVAGD